MLVKEYLEYCTYYIWKEHMLGTIRYLVSAWEEELVDARLRKQALAKRASERTCTVQYSTVHSSTTKSTSE